jgi:hypothetical protein
MADQVTCFASIPKFRLSMCLNGSRPCRQREPECLTNFDYGYLGLVLGADGHTLYYLTGSSLSADSKGAATVKTQEEGSHLITYDISTAKYADHGQIMLDNGDPATAPQSLAVVPDGTVYTLCYVARNGKKGIEMISFLRKRTKFPT